MIKPEPFPGVSQDIAFTIPWWGWGLIGILVAGIALILIILAVAAGWGTGQGLWIDFKRNKRKDQ